METGTLPPTDQVCFQTFNDCRPETYLLVDIGVNIRANQLVIVDDNILEIKDGRAAWIPFQIGPNVRSHLSNLRRNTLTLACSASSTASEILAALISDDVAKLCSLAIAHQDYKTGHSPSVTPDVVCSPKIRNVVVFPNYCAHVFSGHQPGYLRPLGFFAKMAVSDTFCFADDMQFVKREWQNRQRIPMGSRIGTSWLTVPLLTNGHFSSIASKRIANYPTRGSWSISHWRKIESTFGRAPYFDQYAQFLFSLYQNPWRSLAALCEATTRFVALELDICTPSVVSSSSIPFPPGLAKGERIAAEIGALHRLMHIDKPLVYLCGPGAGYLNVRRPSGVRERDFIESRGIRIQTCTVDTTFIARETGLDPHGPAISFLFHFGRHASVILKDAIACQ